MSLRSFSVLLRWLGPWAGQEEAPGRIHREKVVLPLGALAVNLYRSRRRRHFGAYLVVPGLHFLGPDDPRLDRFCRVLAAAGLLVVVPFLPESMDLLISPRVTDDLERAWDYLEARSADERLPKPAMFAVSFGSVAAIDLAARETHRNRIGALVLFGGCANAQAVIRFVVTGRVNGVSDQGRPATPRYSQPWPHDPLNTPAVFLNLMPYLDVAGDPARLAAAWRRMIKETWGRADMKLPGARDPIAAAIAASLPQAERELFTIGCGLRPGGEELLDQGLASGAFGLLDSRPRLARIRAPTLIVHGLSDDIVPWVEALAICAALPPNHPHLLLLTGLFNHGAQERARPGDLGREVRILLSPLRCLTAAPRGTLASLCERADRGAALAPG